MKTINEVLDYCYQQGKTSITIDELKALQMEFQSDDEVTVEALALLDKIMTTHERTYTELENKLIETGVLSGRCYVCWHNNKYYPEATVDNLRSMGFENFYEKFKGNWEKIQNYRKQFYNKGE